MQGRLIVDAFLCGRDQPGTSSSEFVSELDGFFQGHGEAVELPDDYEVEGLPSRVASEIILVNSSRAPALSVNAAETVRPLARQ